MALTLQAVVYGGTMPHIMIENIGDMAVIECEGRIADSTTLELRNAIVAQNKARVLILDLSEVNTVDGDGLGMLVSLHYWAQQRGIQLKVFNPSSSVRHQLERASSMRAFEIASLPEVMGLLIQAENQSSRASANTDTKPVADYTMPGRCRDVVSPSAA
jgi:anti-anti-sigma regulatory factor